MNLRYTKGTRLVKKLYRFFVPTINSPFTLGEVKDICEVHLLPPKKLKRRFVEYVKVLQKLKGNEVGDYLEFGVFNGSSLASMHGAAKEQGLSVRLFGFDAFEGLPAESENEDDGVWKKGFYSCSFEQLTECLKRKDIEPSGITWVKGWYNETLTPATREKYHFNNLGIVFVDCDTYSSSKAVLDFIAPLIQKPAIICLDDWRLYNLDLKGMGEYKSFNEFLESNPHFKIKELPTYKRNARVFLVEP